MKKPAAFTILELSAVLVIIGILIFGITKGVSLVEGSRIKSAQSFTIKSPVADMEGLIAWYESSMKESFKEGEALDGTQISEWRDISAASIVAQKNKLTRSASNAVTYRLDGINKTPSIQFSGATTAKISLSAFYQGSLPQATVILVFRPNSAVLGSTIFDGNSATSSISLDPTYVTLNAGSGASTGTSYNSAAISSGGNYVLAAYLNSDQTQVFINNSDNRIGLDSSDNDPSGLLSIGSNAVSGINIGANAGSSSAFNGLISEVIIFNRPLKLQERKDVFRYLAKKYNIAVSGI